MTRLFLALTLLALAALGCAPTGSTAVDATKVAQTPSVPSTEAAPVADPSPESDPAPVGETATGDGRTTEPEKEAKGEEGAKEAGKPATGGKLAVRIVPTLAAARQVAQAERKTIVLKFEAEWCAFCKLMTKEGFSDQEVAERLKDAVVVPVDVEKNDGKVLAQKYEVLSVPSLVFLNRDETPFELLKGYEDVPWFRARLAQIMAKRGA